MPKRASTTTKDFLVNVALPEKTDSYTVIPHDLIMNTSLHTLGKKSFVVEKELYRCNISGEVASAVYHIKYGTDDEMKMIFSWTNSYDKSTRFKCAVGTRHDLSGNIYISGNMSLWGRKHTGTADQEMSDTISTQIENAELYYNQLVIDKECMKTVVISEKLRAELMGRIFFEEDLLTSEQLLAVKNQFKKPSFDYNSDAESLWTMYNHIAYSLQKSHPKHWLDQQRLIHWFLCKEFGIDNTVVQETATETVNDPGTVAESVPDNAGRQLDLEEVIKDIEQEKLNKQENESDQSPM